MRRLLIGMVVMGIVWAAAVSYAQDSGPAVPEKVRKHLQWQIGTWDVAVDEDVTKATVVYKWAPGEGCVVGESEVIWRGQRVNFTEIIAWDGVSEDGIIGYFVNQNANESHQLKIVSDTVGEGQFSGIRFGRKHTGKERVVKQGPDQYTMFATEIVHGGEPRPDETIVFTRVKDTSDEQELVRLQHEWSRAELAGDADALDRLLADEYVLTLSDGTPMPKAKYLRDIQSEATRSTAMAVENATVRLYGDMALVKGIVKWTEPSGKKHEDLFHETWLKRDGRWQCLATHESGAEETTAGQDLSPEMKKLAVSVGTWSYEGEQADPPVAGLPFGPAGPFSGTVTTRFVLDGRFVEEKIEDHNPGGTTTVVSMTGYDANAKKYVAHAFLSDGSRDTSTETVSADGRTWTSQTTTTTKAGKQVLLRSITKYAPDGDSYTGTTEASPDNGQTWKRWFSAEGKKVKK